MPITYRRSLLVRRVLLLLVFASFLTKQAGAGGGPELVLTDGTRSSAKLIEFEYNAQTIAWQFESATAEPLESTSTNQLVRWGNLSKAKQAATLVLRDGSTLITDRTWAASGYTRVDAKLVGLNRRDGWAMVERSEAEWLLLEAAMEGTHQEELLRSAAGTQSKSDRVWLVGGDQIEGAVQSIENGEVLILLGKKETPNKVPVSRIRAIRFGSVPKEKGHQPICLVGLNDGTLLAANLVQISEKKAKVKTPAGLSLDVEPETVVFLQPLQGKIKYLSDREADDYRSTPYFDLAWPYSRDVSLDGLPLQVQGRRYAKGLALHSAARLVYRLDDQPTDQSLQFQAEVAIADSDPSLGSVVFRVYAIQDNQVEPLYKSPVVRGGDVPLPIDVDLTGAAALVLVVDYADNGDTGDHALWLDARLVSEN